MPDELRPHVLHALYLYLRILLLINSVVLVCSLVLA